MNTVGALQELTDELERRYSGEILGISSGFQNLDSVIDSLEGGRLYVLGARPSMGKTALALNIASNAAIRLRSPVLFVSLEMSQLELANRMVCAEAGVDSKMLRAGNLSVLDWNKVGHAYARMCDAPLWIEDNASISMEKIKTQARELKEAVGDLGLIVVDYLQLLTGSGKESRQQDVSELSRSLKLLARELDTPILALSQLNRTLEQRVDKRPMLADLRESGAIEQDADVVMFIYRDEVYNPDTDDKGTAEILVAKQRNGPTGAVRLDYQASLTRFADAKQAKPKPKVVSQGAQRKNG